MARAICEHRHLLTQSPRSVPISTAIIGCVPPGGCGGSITAGLVVATPVVCRCLIICEPSSSSAVRGFAVLIAGAKPFVWASVPPALVSVGWLFLGWVLRSRSLALLGLALLLTLRLPACGVLLALLAHDRGLERCQALLQTMRGGRAHVTGELCLKPLDLCRDIATTSPAAATAARPAPPTL